MAGRRDRPTTMLGVAMMVGSLLVGACSSNPGSDQGDQVDPLALSDLSDDWVATSDQDEAVRAVLVQVDGELLVENYHGRARKDDHWSVASVTKSVLSLLVGIALEEGVLPGLDSTLAELLPNRVQHMSPGVKDVTLEELLTMTAGTEPDPEMHQEVVLPRGSWVNGALGTRLRDQGSFAYSSVASHLIAASLHHAIGGSILDYARTKLFQPLGIDTQPADERVINREGLIPSPTSQFGWRTDIEGIHGGGLGLVMSAPDLLKLGQLVLDGGRWEGQQLVPRQWIEQSTQSHVRPPDEYGYHWWVMDAAGEHAFAARGFGGQLIQVVPALELVTVVVCAIPYPPSFGSGEPVVSFASQVVAPEVAAATQ